MDENNDIYDSNRTISEHFMVESFNVTHRALLCGERSSINEHLEQTGNLDASVMEGKDDPKTSWKLIKEFESKS